MDGMPVIYGNDCHMLTLLSMLPKRRACPMKHDNTNLECLTTINLAGRIASIVLLPKLNCCLN